MHRELQFTRVLVWVLSFPFAYNTNVITHPLHGGRGAQALTVRRIVRKTLVPGLRRAVSTTVRTSASPWAAHIAR
jgi:hypothetical protein